MHVHSVAGVVGGRVMCTMCTCELHTHVLRQCGALQSHTLFLFGAVHTAHATRTCVVANRRGLTRFSKSSSSSFQMPCLIKVPGVCRQRSSLATPHLRPAFVFFRLVRGLRLPYDVFAAGQGGVVGEFGQRRTVFQIAASYVLQHAASIRRIHTRVGCIGKQPFIHVLGCVEKV